MSVKQIINIFEQMYYIFVILVGFCGKFSMILADFLLTRIRFLEADPDPADQNETDPYGLD